MSSSTSLTSGVAGRYATALFEIARDDEVLEKVEADVLALDAAVADSADLRQLLNSPIYSRDEQGRAIGALAEKMGLGREVASTLGLMAQNRRLFVLPGMIAQLKALIADHRGEVTAEVTAARPLSDAQTSALVETLRKQIGKDVALDVTIDESLIGGLVVKLGSRMLDTSIRSRLASLQNVMKEVG